MCYFRNTSVVYISRFNIFLVRAYIDIQYIWFIFYFFCARRSGGAFLHDTLAAVAAVLRTKLFIIFVEDSSKKHPVASPASSSFLNDAPTRQGRARQGKARDADCLMHVGVLRVCVPLRNYMDGAFLFSIFQSVFKNLLLGFMFIATVCLRHISWYIARIYWWLHMFLPPHTIIHTVPLVCHFLFYIMYL